MSKLLIGDLNQLIIQIVEELHFGEDRDKETA